jgi:MerR family regulatory protein
MEPPSLRAGQVPARAGVHRETLRYYERCRLIPAPPRRHSGCRDHVHGCARDVRARQQEDPRDRREDRSASRDAAPAAARDCPVPMQWQLSHRDPRLSEGSQQ